MKTLLWKEFRQHRWWIGIFALLLVASVFYSVVISGNIYKQYQNASEIHDSLVNFNALWIPILGFVLGFLSVIREREEEMRFFMLHRAHTARQFVISKVVAIFSIYTVIVHALLLMAFILLMYSGVLHAPWSWSMYDYYAVISLIGYPCILFGLLCGYLRKRQLWISVTFFIPVLMPILMHQDIYNVKYYILLIGVIIFILFGSLLGVFDEREGYVRRSYYEKLSYSFLTQISLYGVSLLFFFGVAFIYDEMNQNYHYNSWDGSRADTYETTKHVFLDDGTLGIATVHYGPMGEHLIRLTDLDGNEIEYTEYDEEWVLDNRFETDKLRKHDINRDGYYNEYEFASSHRYHNFYRYIGSYDEKVYYLDKIGNHIWVYDSLYGKPPSILGPLGLTTEVGDNSFSSLFKNYSNDSKGFYGTSKNLYVLNQSNAELIPFFSAAEDEEVRYMGSFIHPIERVDTVNAENKPNEFKYTIITNQALYLIDKHAKDSIRLALDGNMNYYHFTIYESLVDQTLYVWAPQIPVKFSAHSDTDIWLYEYRADGELVKSTLLPKENNSFTMIEENMQQLALEEAMDGQRAKQELWASRLLCFLGGIFAIGFAILTVYFQTDDSLEVIVTEMMKEEYLYAGIQAGLAVSTLIGLVAILLVIKWKRYTGSDKWVWVMWSVIFGALSPVTFLIVNHWPKRVACPDCKAKRPVSEEECPHCGAKWAEPKRDGTEIFEELSSPKV